MARYRDLAVAFFVVASGLPLTGCFAIGHVLAEVPEAQVTVRTTRAAILDLVCADFYGASRSFADLVGGSLSTDSLSYDWKRVSVGAADTQTACREERRYVGTAVIGFLPLGPTSKTVRGRVLFVHVSGERILHRVRLRGGSARVERTNLDDAARRFPPALNAPAPAVRDAEWLARFDLLDNFYSSATWRPSDRIRVLRVSASRDGTISSLVLEVR